MVSNGSYPAARTHSAVTEARGFHLAFVRYGFQDFGIYAQKGLVVSVQGFPGICHALDTIG